MEPPQGCLQFLGEPRKTVGAMLVPVTLGLQSLLTASFSCWTPLGRDESIWEEFGGGGQGAAGDPKPGCLSQTQGR